MSLSDNLKIRLSKAYGKAVAASTKSQFYNPSSSFDNVAYSEEYNKQTGQIDHVYSLTGNASFLSCFCGSYSEANMMLLLQEIPELFAIVDGIATRVKNGEYKLVDKDGKEVEGNKLWEQIKKDGPNWQYTFKDFIAHFIYYHYCTGNNYGYAFIPDSLTQVHKNIKAIWLLPAHYVTIAMLNPRPSYLTTLSSKDYVRAYQYTGDTMGEIAPEKIVHDISIKIGNANDIITGKGVSIFKAAEYPMSNLIATYKARGKIFVNGGPRGAVISTKTDASGSVAMTPDEKQEAQDSFHKDYGSQNGQHLMVISGVPLEYVKIGADIKDLEPFVETLADTVAIAGVAGYPMALIPKAAENKQTNLDVATRDFYTDVIIPKAGEFCSFFTKVCKFDELGLKVVAEFDDVPALQDDALKSAQALNQAAQAAINLYNKGLITKNKLLEIVGVEPIETGGDEYISEEERLANSGMVQPTDIPPTDPGQDTKKTFSLFKRKKK